MWTKQILHSVKVNIYCYYYYTAITLGIPGAHSYCLCIVFIYTFCHVLYKIDTEKIEKIESESLTHLSTKCFHLFRIIIYFLKRYVLCVVWILLIHSML